MDKHGSVMEAPFSLFGGGALAGAGQIQSPYLQFDPTLVSPQQSQSEFIFPDGASRHSRGRFELAFSQIGSSVMSGAAIGGSIGAFKGLQNVSAIQGSLSVKRSQLLNYMTKNGAKMANTFGTIALVYSAIGVGLSFVQERNDDLNTVSAAIATGALYGGLSQPNAKSLEKALSSGQKMWHLQARRSLLGSVVGASLAALYIALVNKEKYFK